jgi:hypothetical protein
MQRHYFGDINDYRKYLLLRKFLNSGHMRIAFWWMLTPDDHRNDGQDRRYIANEALWEYLDPDLYRFLKVVCNQDLTSGIKRIEESDLLSGCCFHGDELKPLKEERTVYMRRFLKAASEHKAQLAFFDSDNGIEVKSIPIVTSRSPKYLFWHEIENAYAQGMSLLILQFFPHESHLDFIRRRRQEIADHTSSKNIMVYNARRVCYFLAAHDTHLAAIEATNHGLEHVLTSGHIQLMQV